MKSKHVFVIAIAALGAAVFIFKSAGAAPTTSLISVDSSSTQGNSDSYLSYESGRSANFGDNQGRVISDDNSIFAFSSNATNLVGSDTNAKSDIFIRSGATTTRVSVVDGTGAQSNGHSYFPAISGDGASVAFESSAGNLVTTDSNALRDVFVHKGTATTRVDVDSSGTQSSGGVSRDPSISSNGNLVAYESAATNLVASDTNAKDDVFVRNISAGTTTRVSTDSSGTQSSGGDSRQGVISEDGSTVAFWSTATNLVASDSNALADIFVKNLSSGSTTRVSVNSAGTQTTGGASTHPSISNDGRYVAFESAATNLVHGDNNAKSDIFVRDTVSNTTTRVSVDNNGVEGNNDSTYPSISGDGRYVTFLTNATNLLVNGGGTGAGVVVYDLQAKHIGDAAVATSGDPNGSSMAPSISKDGRYVAFSSAATNLVASDTGGFNDVFARDRLNTTDVAYAWQTVPSASGGGGWQNAIAVASASTVANRVAVGGDVSGVALSYNSGNSWAPSNNGLNVDSNTSLKHLKIGSLQWSPVSGSSKLFALSGNGVNGSPNNGGAFDYSTDGGQTWTQVTKSSAWWSVQPSGWHPRPTGRLIADVDDSTFYIGTQQGVWKGVSGGTSNTNWSQLPVSIWGSTAQPVITSIMLDPNSGTHDVAYAGINSVVSPITSGPSGGLYRLSGLTGTPTATLATNSPSNVNELVTVNEGGTTVVYAIAGDGASGSVGLFRCPDVSGTVTCTNISSDTTTPTAININTAGNNNGSNIVWSSLDGYNDGTNTVLYLGAMFGVSGASDPSAPGSDPYNMLWKASIANGNTSRTYADLISSSNIYCTMNGSEGANWWYLKNYSTGACLSSGGNFNYQPGQRSYDTAQIAIDPNNHSRILVAGRSGVWRTEDSGTSWYPAVEGMASTIDRQTSIEGAASARLATADTDWIALMSDNSGSVNSHYQDPTTVSFSIPSGVTSSAQAAVFDGSTLYVGVGTNNGSDGQVLKNTSPYSGGTWSQVTGGSPSTAQAIGIGIGDDGTASHNKVVLEAVGNDATNKGLYRWVDNGSGGTWSAVTLSTTIGQNVSNFHDDFFWPKDASGNSAKYVYMYDPPTGLWISTDWGVTWTNYSTISTFNMTGNDYSHSGTMAGYRATGQTSDILYISTTYSTATGGAYKISGVHATPSATAITLSGATLGGSTGLKSGPLAVDSTGRVFVTTQGASLASGGTSNDARLYMATTSGQTSNLTRVYDSTNSNDFGYSKYALFPFDLTISSDNFLYLSTEGNGVAVGVPLIYYDPS